MTSPTTTLPDRPMFLLHASIAIMDAAGRLLLVQEQKPSAYGKWNLPGGHVDQGEAMLDAAVREMREEIKLSLTPTALLGMYQSPRAVRFVYRAEHRVSDPAPAAGDEIMDVRFVTLDELDAMSNEQLVAPSLLRAIVRDLRSDRRLPLDSIHPASR
jgi:ADP-ribose pyrophosphatase YjhB (NUDIX family)